MIRFKTEACVRVEVSNLRRWWKLSIAREAANEDGADRHPRISLQGYPDSLSRSSDTCSVCLDELLSAQKKTLESLKTHGARFQLLQTRLKLTWYDFRIADASMRARHDESETASGSATAGIITNVQRNAMPGDCPSWRCGRVKRAACMSRETRWENVADQTLCGQRRATEPLTPTSSRRICICKVEDHAHILMGLIFGAWMNAMGTDIVQACGEAAMYKQQKTYPLLGRVTLALRLLDAVGVLLEGLVTRGVVLLLDHFD